MSGVSGPLIDRLGTRLGYGLCVAWWSISAMLHALSRGAVSLGVYRFLLGMGEAGNWPGGVKVVAEWFPERERALAAGLFNSGSAVGAILAPPIVAFLVLKWGWQSPFLFVGMAGRMCRWSRLGCCSGRASSGLPGLRFWSPVSATCRAGGSPAFF